MRELFVWNQTRLIVHQDSEFDPIVHQDSELDPSSVSGLEAV